MHDPRIILEGSAVATLSESSELVERPVLGPQGVDERLRVGRRTRGVLDQRGRSVTPPMAVDLAAEPAEEFGEVTPGEGGVEVAKFQPGPREELRGIEIAQGISREVAEQAGAPVDVLEA